MRGLHQTEENRPQPPQVPYQYHMQVHELQEVTASIASTMKGLMKEHDSTMCDAIHAILKQQWTTSWQSKIVNDRHY